jgi:hypothetical protein
MNHIGSLDLKGCLLFAFALVTSIITVMKHPSGPQWLIRLPPRPDVIPQKLTN